MYFQALVGILLWGVLPLVLIELFNRWIWGVGYKRVMRIENWYKEMENKSWKDWSEWLNGLKK